MIRLVVTDLDNTLYDWVGYYVPAFEAMVGALQREHGIEREQLLDAFQRVHRRHGTSEYAFVLTELDVLHDVEALAADPGDLHPAIAAFRSVGRERLKLYARVRETLSAIRHSGRTIVAYTDAMRSYADLRLDELGVAGLFDGLVATMDHHLPPNAADGHIYFEAERFTKRHVASSTELRQDQRKPNPEGLELLMARHGVTPRQTLYVGDSLTRDIAMAQAADVHDVHAGYGHSYPPELWETLVRVTHWSAEDVERERVLSSRPVIPTWTIGGFDQVLDVMAAIEGNPPNRVREAGRARASMP